MAVVTSGTLTQSADGTTLLFTETTTGLGTVTSRVLVISDPNGVVLATVNMGASKTATYTISADAWFSFVETVTDGTGTYVQTIDYLSTAFYEITFANVIAQLGCACGCGSDEVTYADKAQLFAAASLRFAVGGFGVVAQANIIAANIIISGVTT